MKEQKMYKKFENFMKQKRITMWYMEKFRHTQENEKIFKYVLKLSPEDIIKAKNDVQFLRIQILKYNAEVKYKWDDNISNKEQRQIYDDVYAKNKISKHKCYVCGKQAQVRHHIIQLQNGGLNIHDNFIYLCNNCHAEVHPWLKQ